MQCRAESLYCQCNMRLVDRGMCPYEGICPVWRAAPIADMFALAAPNSMSRWNKERKNSSTLHHAIHATKHIGLAAPMKSPMDMKDKQLFSLSPSKPVTLRTGVVGTSSSTISHAIKITLKVTTFVTLANTKLGSTHFNVPVVFFSYDFLTTMIRQTRVSCIALRHRYTAQWHISREWENLRLRFERNWDQRIIG